MNPADARIVENIRQVTQGSAKLLVTLARRGKAIQQERPERAEFLLSAVRTHPLYKGGRLGFDMLEIEDIILEASSFVPMSTQELTQVLTTRAKYFVDALRRIGSVDRHPTQAEAPSQDNDSGRVTRFAANGESESRAVPELPRLILGPTGSRSATAYAGDEGSEERDDYPELLSSDYLYDYVVLGLLDIFSNTAMLQIDNEAAA
jgi:hypothetical protein